MAITGFLMIWRIISLQLQVDIYWKIPLEDFLIDPKLRLCRQNGYGYVRKVSLQLSAIPLEVSDFYGMVDHFLTCISLVVFT